MISLAQFYQAYTMFRPAQDPQQRQAIRRPPQDAIFIVVRPGLGG
jgi:hypothetical protein